MRTRTRITLAGLALGAALAGGVAWATIPADNSLYTACKLKATGTIRLIDLSGPSSSLLSHCTSYETQISWNQKGPAGEAGAAGAKGTNGVDGKDGAIGHKGADGTNGTNGAAGPKGADGTNGTNGSDGVDGAPGAQGPAGPQGPLGSGGGGLASLDSLDGIPCNSAGAAGTVDVAYGPPPAGAITLACKPTTTPTLTVATAGAGSGSVSSDVGGIDCGATCSHSYTVGTVVTLTAASTNDVFMGWSGACTGTGTCAVTMTAAASVTANFALGADLSTYQSGGGAGGGTGGFNPPWHTWSVLSSDPAGLSCQYDFPLPRTCGHRFVLGTTVTLTSSYPNIAWGGACAGATGVTCTLTLDADKNVTALYSV
jgi:hypothetical protein